MTLLLVGLVIAVVIVFLYTGQAAADTIEKDFGISDEDVKKDLEWKR